MNLEPVVPVVISAVALAISILTAWMTLFRRGTIRMTRPAVIFFGPDDRNKAKIFLRALLISTGKRGRVAENIYVMLTRDGSERAFNIWVYEDSSGIVRGSGLFVASTGVEANRHFLLSENDGFIFRAGMYRLQIFAHILGTEHRRLLFSCELTVTDEQERLLRQADAGLYFDWLPEQSQYVPHIDRRKSKNQPLAHQ